MSILGCSYAQKKRNNKVMNEWIKSYNSLPVCPMFYQTPISYNRITPQVKMNEGMNECWEKPQRCMCMSNVLAFFTSQRGDLKFDTNAGLQLSLKYLQLSLRRYIIHWEHRGPNICHGPIYSDTEFYIGWTIAILTWRYLCMVQSSLLRAI